MTDGIFRQGNFDFSSQKYLIEKQKTKTYDEPVS